MINSLQNNKSEKLKNEPGFFDLSDRYESLSKFGDPLETINAVIDFEVFRNPIEIGLCFSQMVPKVVVLLMTLY
jgi:hypothetical protein